MIDNTLFAYINITLYHHPIYYFENSVPKLVGSSFIGELGEDLIKLAGKLHTNKIILSGNTNACNLVMNIIKELDNQMEIEVRKEFTI